MKLQTYVWQEIRRWDNRLTTPVTGVRQWDGWQYIYSIQITGLLLFCIVIVAIIQYYKANWQGLWDDLFGNLAVEAMSIVFTILVLNTLNEMRSNREYKKAVIFQMKSQVNDAAIEAVRIAGSEEWLFDGSLRTIDLREANLHSVNLSWNHHQKKGERGAWYIDLQKADLFSAILSEAQLPQIDLQGADLRYADLKGTDLGYAELQETDLSFADLRGANLSYTYLHGAKLSSANLQDALTIGIVWDQSIVLPNGEFWTEGTDIDLFINPRHPNFWRSNIINSPAYEGDNDQRQETDEASRKSRKSRTGTRPATRKTGQTSDPKTTPQKRKKSK